MTSFYQVVLAPRSTAAWKSSIEHHTDVNLDVCTAEATAGAEVGI